MNRQIVIALLLAMVAGLMTYYYISEKEAAIKADITPLKVLVAKKPISRGTVLSGDKVLIDEIPGAYIMPGAIAAATREEVVKMWKDYKGQFAVVPISKGEQILPNKLSKLLPGFAAIVPEGMRIVSLAFDPAAAIGGHVKPGNRVDVIATFEHEYKKAKRITSVVMSQNVLVTAVGNQTATEKPALQSGKLERGTGSISVCLAVPPEDAVRLTLAEKEGQLKLALRAVGDENRLNFTDQNLGTLLGPLMKVRREEIKPAKRRIQIIRGLQP
ncbi:Flp pilus assembly protein CpaB [bacterium]|nr:Flp pilus assembly protein CpaB [bacterium]